MDPTHAPLIDRMSTDAEYVLCGDGSLVLCVGAGAEAAARAWMPLSAERARHHGGQGRRIRLNIEQGAEFCAPDSDRHLLSLGSVRAHTRSDGSIMLSGRSGRAMGVISPGSADSRLVASAADGPAAADIYSMLTISAALLLAGGGKALVHAGGVIEPGGRAWLLAGDSRSGKTSTLASLVAAGWHFVSDDQVVLSKSSDGSLQMEGWPRIAHLDSGWDHGEITGNRLPVDVVLRWSDRWVRSAPVSGVIFPRIEAAKPSMARHIAPADGFARLVRQSPWLLAEPLHAATGAALLQRACAAEVVEFRLGRDCYADGTRLAAILGGAGSGRSARDRHAIHQAQRA